MVKTALLSTDVSIGSRIVEALDAAGLDLRVAVWVVLAEYEDWRLVIAIKDVDKVGYRESHGLVRKALEKAGISVWHTSSLMMLEMSSPLIRHLRKAYGKFEDKDLEGLRLGPQPFGDQFVEDGLIYRIK